MRLCALPLLGLSLLSTALASASASAERWAAEAASAPDGILRLDSARYDALLAGDGGERDYGVTVQLTAMGPQFKCTPCHEFSPLYTTLARSWRRVKDRDARDAHFFATLDFADGQEIFHRLGLQSAPTVNYYPPTAGPRGGANKPMQNYDLNRAGLSLGNLHMWARQTTPVQFEIYKPMSPWPFVIAPLALATVGMLVWSARSILIPIITSRVIWGAGSIIAILTFTTGTMWVKIKNAPYVQAGRDGSINWIAGGYGNQLGLEGQVMGMLYGSCALCIIVLTVLIPAQASPLKQRIGTLLWVGMLVGLFSVIIRIFRLKNGGYPFQLL